MKRQSSEPLLEEAESELGPSGGPNSGLGNARVWERTLEPLSQGISQALAKID